VSERFDLVGIGMTSQRTRNRLVARLREKGISNEAVLGAIGSVPRHIFIDEALAHRAYEDTALPIGQGQTISQPFIVALMTQVLLDVPRSRVLEVGTGSGYQTAILASLMGPGGSIGKLFTIERLDGLIERARERLDAMGRYGVRYRYGDGYQGWREEGPFDGILVTAAPRTVPEALIDQLAVGGRLVVPVGGESEQSLMVFDRTEDGVKSETVEQVRFVPLVKGIGR
jgi:protein-L-isoaspartate(D-aspartate) O-methyltransferase